jgi:predicted transcriptional regulator
MQIELPQDVVDRVRSLAAASGGTTEAEVIRQALDSLDWQIQERRAIREGIDAWRKGDVQSFDEFDAEFRAANGIKADK